MRKVNIGDGRNVRLSGDALESEPIESHPQQLHQLDGDEQPREGNVFEVLLEREGGDGVVHCVHFISPCEG
jgi:hypothetical protein